MGRWKAEERVPVWPQPRTVAAGSGTAVVTPRDGLIVHGSGCCAPLLAEAIERYLRIIFWVPTSGALPYLRVRTPGGRSDARAPELCDAGADPAPFVQLRIAVDEAEESPLQLGVDESYSLSLSERGGTLTAPSVWGALRGLETFAQLVQWDGDRYVLCRLPLSTLKLDWLRRTSFTSDLRRSTVSLRSAMASSCADRDAAAAS